MDFARRDMLAWFDAGLVLSHGEIAELEAAEHVVRVEVVESLVSPHTADSVRFVEDDDDAGVWVDLVVCLRHGEAIPPLDCQRSSSS